MKRFVAGLLAFALLFCVGASAGAADIFHKSQTEKTNRLSFDENGKLRILQIADIQDGWPMKLQERRLLWAAVKTVQPDLIVLTGDNIEGCAVTKKREAELALRDVMCLLNRFGIPIAAVFGNHDDMRTALTKAEQMDIYMSYENFIGCPGAVAEKTVDETCVNLGTYHLPVYESADSDRAAFGIWCFDSGSRNPDHAVGGYGYGYVFPEQVAWYEETSDALKEQNGGIPLPSIVFQHIAPPHIFQALKEVPGGTPDAVYRVFFETQPDGSVKEVYRFFTLPDGLDPAENRLCEVPCPPEPHFAPGYAELDAMLRHGDVLAVFYGHDHTNNYVVPYRGIDLVCTHACTYKSYNDGRQSFRVITIDKTDLSTYETQTLLWTDVLRGFPLLYAAERVTRYFDKLFSDLGFS